MSANSPVYATTDGQLISGTTGDDVLVTTYNNDTLSGGQGNDFLYSYRMQLVGTINPTYLLLSGGPTTFHVDAGGGHDVIRAYSTSGGNVLEFGAGIRPEDLTLSEASQTDDFYYAPSSGNTWGIPKASSACSSLEVRNTKTGDELDIASAFDALGHAGFSGIDLIRFADGPTLTWDQWTGLLPKIRRALAYADGVTVKGENQGDTLIGGAAHDTLIASGGTARIEAGDGQDLIDARQDASATLVVDAWTGYGQADTLTAGNEDVLRLTGMSQSQLALMQLDAAHPDQITLTSSVTQNVLGADTGYLMQQTLAISGVSLASSMRVELDDAVLTAGQLQTIASHVQGQTLTGDTQANTLTGSVANDVLQGGGSNDTLLGQSGDDVLQGDEGDDVLQGGFGNDTMDGGAGADLYQSTRGLGRDVITLDNQDALQVFGFTDMQFPLMGSTDQLDVTNYWSTQELLHGLSMTDATTVRLSLDAETSVDLANAGAWDDARILDRNGVVAFNGIDLRVHAMGPIASQQITGASTDEVLHGGMGDDRIDGGAGNDLIDGGGYGNDILLGGAGNDTLKGISTSALTMTSLYGDEGDDTYEVDSTRGEVIVYAGVGQDVLHNKGSKTLVYLEDKTTQGVSVLDNADLTWSADGLDLLVGSTATGERVRITSYFDNVHAADAVASVNDLTRDQVLAKFGTGTAGNDQLFAPDSATSLAGGAGNDVLHGGAGDDTLNGGTGNDTIWSGGGADTVVFNKGDGNDVLELDAQDTIKLGAGWRVADMTIGQMGASVVGRVSLSFVGGDSLALDNLAQIQGLKLAFSDGTTVTGADILKVATNPPGSQIQGTSGQDKLMGGAGNDTLIGLGGKDTLIGGAGDDLLQGGKGADTYVFNRGEGHDTIVENDATWFTTDVLQLGNVKSNQLWFSRQGNNLDVSIIGTHDHVTVQDWFKGSAYHVERITALGDGKSITDAKVNLLVAAMAMNAPPAFGQTSWPASEPTALTKLVASSWV